MLTSSNTPEEAFADGKAKACVKIKNNSFFF